MNRIIMIPGWGADERAWDGVASRLRNVAACVMLQVGRSALGRPNVVADHEVHDASDDVMGTRIASLDSGRSSSLTASSRRSRPWIRIHGRVRPALLGWSLGAIQALQMALHTPEAFSGIILISGAARFTADGEYPGADARALRAMLLRLRKNREAVLADFARRCVMPDGSPEHERCYLDQASTWDTSELLAGLETLATLDLRADLANVTLPVLMVHGTDDAIIPLASAQYLAQRLPRCDLRVLDGRGHALPLTAGELLATMVREFVDEHSTHP